MDMMSRHDSNDDHDTGGEGSPPRPELDVVCPCCETRLSVDATTGVVLHEERRKKPRPSFDNALAAERQRQAESDDLFGKALASERNNRALLDRKFEKALKKAAKEPDKKLKHPLDGD